MEAKDLKPHAATGYKMQKIFGGKLPSLPGFKKAGTPRQLQQRIFENEQYYLDMIKLQPRNLANYDALGKFYLNKGNTT